MEIYYGGEYFITIHFRGAVRRRIRASAKKKKNPAQGKKAAKKINLAQEKKTQKKKKNI